MRAPTSVTLNEFERGLVDHVRRQTGMSFSAVARRLLLVYAAGTEIPGLPTISAHERARNIVDGNASYSD